MKIIYIPVVIPVNVRTLWALLLCFAAAILISIAVATESWLVMTMDTENAESQHLAISKIIAYQSLQFVDVQLCRPSEAFRVKFCSTTHVVYAQCDDASDAWCQGGPAFLTALGAGIAAILVAMTSVGVGLVRELAMGYLAGLAALCSVVGSVAYATGYNKAVGDGILAAIYQEAQVDHGTVTHSLGFSFYSYLLGSVFLCCAAALSISLYFCAAHGEENRAHQAPKIQVVEMDIRGSAEVAAAAPQPGFVRLESGGYGAGDDDDDDDLITVPPPLPANYYSPTKPREANVASGGDGVQPMPDPARLEDLPHDDA